MDWCYLGLRGAFERILLMWDRRIVEKIECVGIFCSLLIQKCRRYWVSAAVYGRNVNNDRRMFWDELARLISW